MYGHNYISLLFNMFLFCSQSVTWSADLHWLVLCSLKLAHRWNAMDGKNAHKQEGLRRKGNELQYTFNAQVASTNHQKQEKDAPYVQVRAKRRYYQHAERSWSSLSCRLIWAVPREVTGRGSLSSASRSREVVTSSATVWVFICAASLQLWCRKFVHYSKASGMFYA